MPVEIWPGSGLGARRGAHTRRRADQRPRGAPGDRAKIEEAVRRLRGAEVLELDLNNGNLGGRAQGVGWLLVSCSHARETD